MDFAEAKSKAATLQSRAKQFLGSGQLIFSSTLFGQFWESLMGRGGGYPIPGNPVPLEVWNTWIAGDASQFVKSFDSASGVVEFDRPMGIPSRSISARQFLLFGAELLRRKAKVSAEGLEEQEFDPPIAELFSSFCTIAKHIDIITDDDEANSFITEGARQGGRFIGGAPGSFVSILQNMVGRSAGRPIWQIASLKTANDTPGKQPEEPKNFRPDEAGPPGGADTDADAAADDGSGGEDTPVDVPSGEPGPGATPVDAPVPGGDAGPDVAVPNSDGPGQTTTGGGGGPGGAGSTETTTLPPPPGPTVPQPSVGPAALPNLSLPPVVGRFFVEAPFDEAAWPRIDVGGPGPIRIERLNVPFVVSLAEGVLTQGFFSQAALNRFAEINAESTVEESEEVEIGGVFKVGMGGVVRNVTISFGEGGSRPRVRVSGSNLITRRLPALRAFTAAVATGRKG